MYCNKNYVNVVSLKRSYCALVTLLVMVTGHRACARRRGEVSGAEAVMEFWDTTDLPTIRQKKAHLLPARS